MTNEQRAASVRAKAETMTARAIGAEFSVRTGKNEVVRGTITKCEVAGVKWVGMSVFAIFKVQINGIHTVTVRQIPQ